jgi:hypothetical protein
MRTNVIEKGIRRHSSAPQKDLMKNTTRETHSPHAGMHPKTCTDEHLTHRKDRTHGLSLKRGINVQTSQKMGGWQRSEYGTRNRLCMYGCGCRPHFISWKRPTGIAGDETLSTDGHRTRRREQQVHCHDELCQRPMHSEVLTKFNRVATTRHR